MPNDKQDDREVVLKQTNYSGPRTVGTDGLGDLTEPQPEQGKQHSDSVKCPSCGEPMFRSMAWVHLNFRHNRKCENRSAFGGGDYSCATCGLGMLEPCEHWKGIMARNENEPEYPPSTAPKVDPLVEKIIAVQHRVRVEAVENCTIGRLDTVLREAEAIAAEVRKFAAIRRDDNAK